MQTRVYLLFILFVVVAVFAATRDGVSTITTELQAQTEMFDQLNEIGSERSDIASTSSGN